MTWSLDTTATPGVVDTTPSKKDLTDPNNVGMVGDHNRPNPQTVPPALEPKTPEYLDDLMNQLNDVRQELSKRMAAQQKLWKTTSYNEYTETIQERTKRRNETRALEDKEESLMAAIRDQLYLIPPEKRPATLGRYG